MVNMAKKSHPALCDCRRCNARNYPTTKGRTRNRSRGTSDVGAHFPTGDSEHVTVNPTENPKVPDGHYVSIGDDKDHSTAVYDEDGSLADVKANKDWVTRPRQDG